MSTTESENRMNWQYRNSERSQFENRYINSTTINNEYLTSIKDHTDKSSNLLIQQEQITARLNEDSQRRDVGYRSAEGASFFDPNDADSGLLKDKRWSSPVEKYSHLKVIDDGRAEFSSFDRNYKRKTQSRCHAVETISGKIGFNSEHPVPTRTKQRLLDIESIQSDVEGLNGLFQTCIVITATEHRIWNRERSSQLSAWIERVRTHPEEVAQKIEQRGREEVDPPYTPLEEIEVFAELMDEFDLTSSNEINKAAKSIYGSEYIRPQFAEKVQC